MMTDIAALLRAAGAVEYGDFTLASGERSTYYLDIKTAVTDPFLLGTIGREITQIASFDQVAGVAVGGIPIAVATALAAGKRYAIIRSAEKTHGKSGTIIGAVSGRKVLLVEDVTTSGGSALYGVRVLREAGAIVETVITVVDREAGAARRLGAEEVRLIPLTTASSIVQE
jgi:orotate phosphoribosyltransferase